MDDIKKIAPKKQEKDLIKAIFDREVNLRVKEYKGMNPSDGSFC